MDIKSGFFISKARLALSKLRQVFVKTLIFYHFNPKYYIQIQIYISKYIISEILSLLTLDNFGQWYLVVFFS